MKDENMKRFLSPKSAGIIEQLEEQDSDWDDWDDEDEEEDEIIHLIELGSEEEKESIREAKLTLKGMYVSFIALTIFFLLIGLLLVGKKITYTIGIITGLITGLFYITHLNSSIKEILNYDEESAVRAMKRDAKVRLGVVGISGILVAAFVGGNSALGVLAQIFAIKLSAYLTPLTAKILDRKIRLKEVDIE